MRRKRVCISSLVQIQRRPPVLFFSCSPYSVFSYFSPQVWDVCEELQTFIQDSKEVLWSEVRHIPDIEKV